MDYIAHGFWSYIFFHRIKTPLLAVAFGLMPDTISWGVYAVYQLFISGDFGKPIISQVPAWTFVAYNISHSLVVAGAVMLLIFLLLRRMPLYVYAWPIAIAMDVFTHSKDFLPTPFLWPISDWRFPGIKWSTWQFMAINYTLIAIALSIIIYRKKKR